MQKTNLKIVHYLNQFFGGIGGEDKADIGPLVKQGAVGPGKLAQQSLAEGHEIVATIICGDNYFAQGTERATEEVLQLLAPYKPDAVIAGPAFFAGRYAIACGALCQAVQNRLGIPAVTGMYKENPAADLYARDVFIIQTGSSAKDMAEVLPKMVRMAVRLASGLEIGKPAEEGTLPRGILINETTPQNAAERAVSMLLAKVSGQPFESEVPLPDYDNVHAADGIRDMTTARIALVTDGGLVPTGNPDRIEPERATKYGRYSIEAMDRLNPGEFDVNHAGYTPVFVKQDPNRLLPVDVMRDLEREGAVGALHHVFFSTSGCASILMNVKKMGRSIAEELKKGEVNGVILTST